MRLRVLFMLCFVCALAACQGVPPTVVYIVVTATPDATTTAREATRDAAVTLVAQAITPSSTAPIPTRTPAPPTPASPDTASPAPTSPGPTPLPAGFPTPVIAQITVAEQLFEGGRMFWIQPTGQIWLLTLTGEGRGDWAIYADDFTESDIASDPALVPPAGRYQPERGFGKLWREADAIRQALGWGVTPEFGYVSRYEYHAGGSIDPATGVYTPGPGYHILFSLGGELFRFNEADSTWTLGDASR
jgi:hypothetical protein